MTGRFDHLWAPRDGRGADGAALADVVAASVGAGGARARPRDPAPPEAPAAAASAAPAAAPPPGGFDLLLSTGERLRLDRAIVIGREPRVEAGALGVRVAPHLLDLSRSHLAVEPAEAGAVVRDLASANGSALVRDGRRTPLSPHEPAGIGPGDAVVLADALEIRLEPTEPTPAHAPRRAEGAPT